MRGRPCPTDRVTGRLHRNGTVSSSRGVHREEQSQGSSGHGGADVGRREPDQPRQADAAVRRAQPCGTYPDSDVLTTIVVPRATTSTCACSRRDTPTRARAYHVQQQALVPAVTVTHPRVQQPGAHHHRDGATVCE